MKGDTMEYQRGLVWPQIAHEHVKAKIKLLISEIRLDIQFGRLPALLALRDENQPKKRSANLTGTAFGNLTSDFLADYPPAIVSDPEALPPLQLYKILFDLGDKWTTSAYRAYCDVWSDQGKQKTEAFILDVWYGGILPFQRNELPSLFGFATMWAVPSMVQVVTDAAERPPQGQRIAEIRLTKEKCRTTEQLQGISRTIDDLIGHWNGNTLITERREARGPAPSEAAIALANFENRLNGVRGGIAVPGGFTVPPLILPMVIPPEQAEKAIRTTIPEGVETSDNQAATVTKDIESRRLVTKAPPPPAEVGGHGWLGSALPKPISPVSGYGSYRRKTEPDPAPPPKRPNVPTLEETELRAMLSQIDGELRVLIQKKQLAPNLAGEYSILVDSLRRERRKQELRIQIYVFDKEAKEKKQDAEAYKVSVRYHEQLLQEARAAEYHKTESENEMALIVAHDQQWEERTQQARSTIANALRAPESATKNTGPAELMDTGAPAQGAVTPVNPKFEILADDCSLIRFDRTEYALGPQASKMVKFLYDAHMSGKPWKKAEEVKKAINAGDGQLSQLFTRSTAKALYNTLVVQKHGLYSLSI